MWMAPNMVTLLGWMWIVANVFLMEFLVPDLVGPVRMTPAAEKELIAEILGAGPRVVVLQFRTRNVDVSIPFPVA